MAIVNEGSGDAHGRFRVSWDTRYFKELADIAKDMGKIMIFAEHDRAKDDLELVCYDEIDTPEIPTTKTVNIKPQEPTNLF